MGTVLSIIAVVATLYVYGRRANAMVGDVGHDPTKSSAINTKSEQSDEVGTQGHRTKGNNLLATSSFHSAKNVDASHAIFSDVGGDQHINIATNIDPDPDRRSIGDWLSPLNFKLNQIENFQIREDGTGEWLLESSDFKDWRDGPSGTLWCPGIPGAGKTVLASIIVDHLQTFFKGSSVAITCIYCNYKEQLNQTAFNLVASLLKQLVQDDSVAYNNVDAIYKRHKHQETRPTLDEIKTALQSETERYSKTFIIVDALDESSDVDGSRGKLLTALRSLGRTVSLLVTSRDIASIAQEFSESKRLEIHASEQDVRRYIEGRIPHEPRLTKHVYGDPGLQETIVNKITENVQGMFLLARLHMDSLATTISRRELRNGLESLPMEVNATYDETIKRIEGQIEGDMKLTKQIFSWTIFAYRPLSLDELRHALAVSPGMTEMDPDALVDETILTSEQTGFKDQTHFAQPGKDSRTPDAPKESEKATEKSENNPIEFFTHSSNVCIDGGRFEAAGRDIVHMTACADGRRIEALLAGNIVASTSLFGAHVMDSYHSRRLRLSSDTVTHMLSLPNARFQAVYEAPFLTFSLWAFMLYVVKYGDRMRNS